MANIFTKAWDFLTGLFKAPKIDMPPVPAPPPPPPAAEPEKAAQQQARAESNAKKKAALMAGIGNTVATSALGVPGPATVTSKTLLGQ